MVGAIMMVPPTLSKKPSKFHQFVGDTRVCKHVHFDNGSIVHHHGVPVPLKVSNLLPVTMQSWSVTKLEVTDHQQRGTSEF
jgi:hypothetical protein